MSKLTIFLATMSCALCCATAAGQSSVHIPATTIVPNNTAAGGAASFPPTLSGAPGGASSGVGTASGVTLGPPSFDPYAAPAPGYGAPSSNPFTSGLFGGQPTYPPAGYTAPPGYPGAYPPPPATPYGYPAPNPYGQPFPQQPPVQYPGGAWSDDIGRANPYHAGEPLRLFQNLRIRDTWVGRDDELTGLGMNDAEAATTVAFPSFLFTTQPLYVSPGFIFHLWDGPGGRTADLPGQAYTAYVDFDYTTNPNLRFGGDLHVRTGLYTDFQALEIDAFRISGRGLGTFRFNPAVQLKFGVEYINRNDLKLLPAGGILWTPNPQVRFDIYFPKPKLAMYVTTLGQTEVWGYLTGEYGGGAWLIERASGFNDRVDINDLRVGLGMEFMTGRSLKGFIEGGFVFSREVVYVYNPGDTFSPGDTFMVRGGLAY